MFRIMFLTGLAFTILFLLLSIILFVKNDVAKLIGDVTGWNARRAIKRINEKGAEKLELKPKLKSKLKPKQSIMSAIHEAQGKSVEEVFQDEDEMIVLAGQETAGTEQEKMLGDGDELTTVLDEGDELTTVLGDGDELTTVLDEGDGLTTVLGDGDELTTVLDEGDGLTTVLGEEETTVLEGLEDSTVVIADESTSILNMAERIVIPTSGEDEAAGILTGEEKPLPDIFEVEEQATVVHTDKRIGDESAGE